MVHRPDKDTIDDAAWDEAVAREAVIRRLVALDYPGRTDLLRACHELGLKRTRLYELIRAYREHPVTSSLLPCPAGTRRGSRRLPDETEAVIAEALRDFYLRAGWMLAERCICPAHGELLLDRCLSCHRPLSVAFRLREGCARPVCNHCDLILADRGGEGGQPLGRSLVRSALAIQQRITEQVDRGTAEQKQFEKTLSILWAPLDHPGAARPVLALWFNEAGWRCPYEARHAVGADAPLGQLPVRWRLLTLLAMNDVFGADLRVDGALPPAAAHLARRAAPRQIRLSSRRPRVRILKRSSAEYERLARQILADPGWIAAEELPWQKRQRVRARLIDAALSGNPVAGITRSTRVGGTGDRWAGGFGYGETACSGGQSQQFRFIRPHKGARDFVRVPDWREFWRSARRERPSPRPRSEDCSQTRSAQ